ncbi:MAG: phosphoribosylformylglycinamidine synthase subunit PurS [Epsilonproteobacteria bacterium]|nr:phosphoribosylformylglycinamidine synthase [Campylobacterota bacterium]NPA56130.1 phosphoribosylformylglycinamidine synthase subunit PurS [Campylobacterota bacterium]
MRAIVTVHLKEGVLDPQGKAVHHALHSLGFRNSEDVRVGKQIVVTLRGEMSREEAEREVTEMCEKLLANTVIEDYEIEIIP